MAVFLLRGRGATMYQLRFDPDRIRMRGSSIENQSNLFGHLSIRTSAEHLSISGGSEMYLGGALVDWRRIVGGMEEDWRRINRKKRCFAFLTCLPCNIRRSAKKN